MNFGGFEHIQEKYLSLGKPKAQELKLSPFNYFDFMGLVHKGGLVVVVIALAIPALLKFYLAYLVG